MSGRMDGDVRVDAGKQVTLCELNLVSMHFYLKYSKMLWHLRGAVHIYLAAAPFIRLSVVVLFIYNSILSISS